MATRRDTPFREAMRSLLVFDGAMGSLLYERRVFVTQNFEQLNVTRPDIVRKIHDDYVAAGAQVIETNTYGARPDGSGPRAFVCRLASFWLLPRPASSPRGSSSRRLAALLSAVEGHRPSIALPGA